MLHLEMSLRLDRLQPRESLLTWYRPSLRLLCVLSSLKSLRSETFTNSCLKSGIYNNACFLLTS